MMRAFNPTILSLVAALVQAALGSVFAGRDGAGGLASLSDPEDPAVFTGRDRGGDLTSDPDPADPGVFCWCKVDIVKNIQIKGSELGTNYGNFFFPRKRDTGDNNGECVENHNACDEVNGGRYHHVVIHYALGSNADAYDGIGSHLASHGFAVTVLAKNTDAAFAAEALEFVYSSVGGSLTGDVGLIGHSAGGDIALRHARYVKDPPVSKNLRVVILMAPRVFSDESFDLQGITNAFLGLHWTGDNDSATFGALGPPRRSVFKVYDNVGIVADDADSLSLTKDFVFLDLEGHYQQNNEAVVAYTTAFLHRHLAGRTIYDRFLAFQEVPPSLSAPVSQQHAGPGRLALANFEVGNLAPTVFDSSSDNSVGAIVVGEGLAWELDDFSPHDSRVLKFSVPGPSDGSEIELQLSQSVPLHGYTFFSMRITQVYHNAITPTGSECSFDVVLCDANGGAWAVNLADYGGIPFPIVRDNLVLSQAGAVVDGTKNAMRTFRIRLSDFAIPPGAAINSVKFDFSDSDAEGADFIVDDIELYP